eukprot:6232820-Amphidinium_carterae.1
MDEAQSFAKFQCAPYCCTQEGKQFGNAPKGGAPEKRGVHKQVADVAQTETGRYPQKLNRFTYHVTRKLGHGIKQISK